MLKIKLLRFSGEPSNRFYFNHTRNTINVKAVPQIHSAPRPHCHQWGKSSEWGVWGVLVLEEGHNDHGIITCKESERHNHTVTTDGSHNDTITPHPCDQHLLPLKSAIGWSWAVHNEHCWKIEVEDFFRFFALGEKVTIIWYVYSTLYMYTFYYWSIKWYGQRRIIRWRWSWIERVPTQDWDESSAGLTDQDM